MIYWYNKKGIIINTILKNVYAFRDSQNSATSLKKIVLNESLPII